MHGRWIVENLGSCQQNFISASRMCYLEDSDYHSIPATGIPLYNNKQLNPNLPLINNVNNPCWPPLAL